MPKIYFDHSATTPVHPEVLQAMTPFFCEAFGNPASIHAFGRQARVAIDEAREKVALMIGARSGEIIFTSGGTEAINTAITGVARALGDKGRHIITSAVEHHASLDTCKSLAREGYEVTFLPVDGYGMVSTDQVRDAIRDDTILINIMHANNEVGTIQPVEEIGLLAREKGIAFHCDAVQSAGKIKVDVNDMNVDLLSIAAHKFNGPKGIGALFARKGVRWQRMFRGGAQERSRRAGTENVPGIVGMGLACAMAKACLEEEAARLIFLRDRLIKGVLDSISHVFLTGHPEKRLPNLASFCFKYIEGESILLGLDMKGIAASSGSACTSGSLEPSHVLAAMHVPIEVSHGSLRLSLGQGNAKAEVDYFLAEIVPVVERLRAMSPIAENI